MEYSKKEVEKIVTDLFLKIYENGAYKALVHAKDMMQELDKVKKLNIPDVSQQRELLIGFAEVYQSCHLDETVENTVDWYLRVKDN